jgi:hypothetical protein
VIAPNQGGGNTDGSPGSSDTKNAQTYFDQKNPQSKIEELAVAARYRELKEGVETHEKEDLKRVITSARRNFDVNNYTRDLGNA